MDNLQLGGRLPLFTLKDQNGNVFSSHDCIGKHPLVIYFYPKNFTPGCTRGACGFRDHFEDFASQGAKVVGISADSINSHQKFVERYQLPFTLLSDPENRVRKQFGVKPNFFGILPGRETFVFDKDGKLVFQFRSMGADAHIEEALKHL